MSGPGRSRRRTFVGAWLNAARTPMYLLDDRRRVVFFNAGCEKLTGWTAEDVTGHVCEYAVDDSDEHIDDLTCSLCPPPDVFEGEPRSIAAFVSTRDGRTHSRLLNFFPLTDDEGGIRFVLGVMTEVGQPAAPSEDSPSRMLHAELSALRSSLRRRFNIGTLIGRCPAMRRALDQLEFASRSTISVFLRGEPGTGREHLARVIHNQSDRRSRSFIPLDCRAIQSIDLQLTLRRLLHTDKADTAQAHLQAGSLFFANADRMPRDVQQLVVELCGPDAHGRRKNDDVRLMVASKQDPRSLMESDCLQPEFMYLLTTLQIDLPPLRARGDDIALLGQYFLEQCNRGQEHQVGRFAPEVLEQFHARDWPGNVAELRQVVREAHAACTTTTIRPADLSFRFRTGMDAQRVGPAIRPRAVSLEQLLIQIEAHHIRESLRLAGNNKSKAAELLGLTRARLYRRMQQLGIEDHTQS